MIGLTDRQIVSGWWNRPTCQFCRCVPNITSPHNCTSREEALKCSWLQGEERRRLVDPAMHPDGRPEWTGKQAQGPHPITDSKAEGR